MTSPDGRFTVVFNGEIYNYLEIKMQLARRGHTFRTSSDTEVLLAAYQEWGESCVERFNGMWAFVIHDRTSNQLFGSRDRMGVKPLYIWHDEEWIVLASEMRAIVATGLVSGTPNLSHLADFIVWGRMDHGSQTCLAGIESVPAGHNFTVTRDKGFQTRAYWQPPRAENDASDRSEEEWVEELASLVTDAVRLRMRSDVPVGFTMSGGIDSSLLVCEAAHLVPLHRRLTAFSYQDIRYDEQRQISDTVRQTNAQLFSLTNEDIDVVKLLPEVVHAHGQPIHSLAAIANYELFRLARIHGIKVVIGGQGADEALCGYPVFQQHYWRTLASERKWRALYDDTRRHAALVGRSGVATFLGTLRDSLWRSTTNLGAYRWLADRYGTAYPKNAVTTNFSPEFLRLASRSPWRQDEFHLNAVQRQQLVDWPLPLYLRIEDRNSMAHSVEARLPFTDYRIVEHALRMPDTLKYSGGLNKVALRRVAQGRVPHSVSARKDKFGFSISATTQTARNLHKLCHSLSATRSFRERSIYSMREIEGFLSSFRPTDGSHVSAAFQLAQTELWLQGLEACGA